MTEWTVINAWLGAVRYIATQLGATAILPGEGSDEVTFVVSQAKGQETRYRASAMNLMALAWTIQSAAGDPSITKWVLHVF